jgi:acetylornithine deacetylase/succinyl-diaminopimelate desuccinylase-like protein
MHDWEPIRRWLALRDAEVVAFAGELVRTPSLPGDEGALSELLRERLLALGVPAEIDRAGNLLGGLPEAVGSNGLLFVTHTDHAAPGAMSDPYAGDLRDGAPYGHDGPVLWGRGVNGQKAALAAMAYALGALRAVADTIARPVCLAGLVMEEGGGHIGPRELCDERGLRPAWVVIGENTDLAVHTGHRGIVNLRVTLTGKAVHASVPQDGANALLAWGAVCRVLEARAAELPRDPVFGPLTITPTMLSVTPDVSNVVPERCVANLDCRVLPGWTPAQVRALVADWLAGCGGPYGVELAVEVASRSVRTWTGLQVPTDGCILPFATPVDDALVRAGVDAVEAVTGAAPEVRLWRAGTDGGFFQGALGIPTIGIAPGQARYSHTVDEHVPARDIPRAAAIYARLALDLCV